MYFARSSILGKPRIVAPALEIWRGWLSFKCFFVFVTKEQSLVWHNDKS